METQTAQHDPSPSAAILPHSTPLHPTSPPTPSFQSTPPPTSSYSHSRVAREGERNNDRTQDKRRRKRKWRRKGAQVHPVANSVPHPIEEQPLLPAFPSPTNTTSQLPTFPHSFATPLQSSNGRQALSPSLLSPPARDMSCSLPPLLSSRVRKGGRRPSPSTDWSSCGPAELERCLPMRELSLFVGTWNMQEMTTLPECLDDFLLPAGVERVPELYVVGTQESTGGLRDWEVLLQQTLGPSHLLVSSSSLGELTVLLFLRRDLLWFCSEVQCGGYSTRPGAAVKTKGGVGLSFSLFGTTFLFVSSHFTAHQDRVEERNSDMQRVAANLTTNQLSEFDYVFWLGDLNYRVDMDRGQVDRHISQWQQQQGEGEEEEEEGERWHQDGWLPLLLHDQLTREMLNGHVFQGFSEQPINFPPSYKFLTNSDLYDPKRIPSWTDRILFRSRLGSGVSGCGYDLCHSLKCSDHRPVYGVFRVRLEPSTDTDGLPGTMASFNRDVYRIAQRKRKEVATLSLSLRDGEDSGGPPPPASRTSHHVTSSFCSIL